MLVSAAALSGNPDNLKQSDLLAVRESSDPHCLLRAVKTDRGHGIEYLPECGWLGAQAGLRAMPIVLLLNAYLRSQACVIESVLLEMRARVSTRDYT